MATAIPNNWRDSLPPGVAAYAKLIDENWDDFTIDITTCTAKQVNGFILHQLLFYRSRSYTDFKLWECFREDFAEWTLNTWKLGNTQVVQEFRDFLRRNGVAVVKDGSSIAGNIQAIIDNQQEPNWTPEEIHEQMNNEPDTNIFSNEGNFNSKLNPLCRPKGNHQPPTRPMSPPQQPPQEPPQQPPQQRLQQRPQESPQEPPPIPPAIPTAAPPVVPIAEPAVLSVEQQPPQEPPQRPQQLHIHTPPKPAVTSMEQGPRQGPRYSKEGVPASHQRFLTPFNSSAETFPLTPTAPGQPAQQARSVNDIPTHQQPPQEPPRQSPLQPLQQFPQQPLQEPPQQYPQQYPQQPPQKLPQKLPQKPLQRPRSANGIFDQQQQSSIPPQTFNKLQKIQRGGGFQDFCGSQGGYRGGYQRDLDRNFSWRVP